MKGIFLKLKFNTKKRVFHIKFISSRNEKDSTNNE